MEKTITENRHSPHSRTVPDRQAPTENRERTAKPREDKGLQRQGSLPAGSLTLQELGEANGRLCGLLANIYPHLVSAERDGRHTVSDAPTEAVRATRPSISKAEPATARG